MIYSDFRTEEIRKSIETLDRILDQYDGESPSGDDKVAEKKYPGGLKVDPKAQILASCLKTAGSHKLRKRTGMVTVLVCSLLQFLAKHPNLSIGSDGMIAKSQNG